MINLEYKIAKLSQIQTLISIFTPREETWMEKTLFISLNLLNRIAKSSYQDALLIEFLMRKILHKSGVGFSPISISLFSPFQSRWKTRSHQRA